MVPTEADKLLWLRAVFRESQLRLFLNRGKTFCAFQKVHLIVTKNDGCRQLYSLEAAVKAADPRH